MKLHHGSASLSSGCLPGFRLRKKRTASAGVMTGAVPGASSGPPVGVIGGSRSVRRCAGITPARPFAALGAWVPAAVSAGLPEVVAASSASVAAWTVIYALRALTEERHLLMLDNGYSRYMQNVPFRFVPKIC